MKVFFKKFISLFLLVSIVVMQSVGAVDLAGFAISVSQNPMKPGEPVDVTIKAIDPAGATVTDYKGVILIDVGIQDENMYDISGNGFYQFMPQDQGIKTLSKGLTIKKSGQHTIRAYDSVLTSMAGTLALTVGSVSDTSTIARDVQILEPLSDSKIQGSALNIIGKTTIKKTPLQFFIDNKKLSLEGETDDMGNFSIFVTDILSGEHTLQVKTANIEGKILGESEIIPFSFIPPVTDGFLKSFSATPAGEIKIGESVVFDAQVDNTVRSVEMKIGTLGTFIMDRTASGVFNKSVVIDKSGTHKVDLTVIFEGGQRTIYADRATLNIKGPDGISLLKAVNNIADPSKVSLSWSPVGTPASYIIRYGNSKDILTGEIKTGSTVVEIGMLDIGKEYFFQVFTVDSSGAIATKGSDIAFIITQGQSAAGENIIGGSCTVVGIKIRTEKIGDQYFLVRAAVPGAVEYHIYKSDYEVNSIQNMQKIGSSKVSQFAYPFDASAKKDTYSFYSVVATCSDGQNLQIDSVKKVHTGPLSDMLILFFTSLISYFLYRIYRYNY